MKSKLLIITPHLSTGGSPQYIVEFLKYNKRNYSEIKIVEFSLFSDIYNIQKDKIKTIIGEDNLSTYGYYLSDTFSEDKRPIIKLIDSYSPDLIWMNEFPEAYEYVLPPNYIMDYIYREDRPYRIFSTTHYNAFDFKTLIYIPDSFMFCSDKHIIESENINIPKNVWETPIVHLEKPDRKTKLLELGLDPDKIHVLNVGLINANKNQKFVFDIASDSDIQNRDVHFHFIGNDCFINETGITDSQINQKNCTIWGERDDVSSFMSCMDIYFFPSNKELNPLTIREALSWDMEVIVKRDEYVNQYTTLDNFHIIDEIDVKEFILNKLKTPKNDKFLIVTSFYNNTNEQINITFDCLLNQTHQNWVYIVGDDESTNSCESYLKYKVNQLNDDRIIFYNVKFKRELYLYQNFFKEFKYDFYLDLDSDDKFETTLLETYKIHYNKFPNVNSIFCDADVVNEDGQLQRHYLVKPTKNVVSDFKLITDSKYYDIWEKLPSWNLFGVCRSFRRSVYDSFDIIYNGRTATDSMVLVNTLKEGEHLHIPKKLYTYINRNDSDSSEMSTEEHSHFNDNTLHAFKDNKYGYNDFYNSIYLETSALIMSGFDFNTNISISIISDMSQEDIDKLQFLYENVKVNDFSCINLLFINNHVIEEIKTEYTSEKRVFVYNFLDKFEDIENIQDYLSNGFENFLKSMGSFKSFFTYFRHSFLEKNIDLGNVAKISDFFGVRVDIESKNDADYVVEFLDGDKKVFNDTIKDGMYCAPSSKYYIDWNIKVDGKTVYTQNLKDKNVFIGFESSALGDTLCWFPAIEEFRIKHQCNVTVSTFKNLLFDKSKYPHIKFINPGDSYKNMHKMYQLGWFYKDDEVDSSMNKRDFKKIPLADTAYDILGLDKKVELKPEIDFTPNKRTIKEKYITFSPHSTALAKYWNNKGAWQELINFFNSKGYKMVMISNEANKDKHQYTKIGGELTSIIDKTGKSLSSVMNLMHHSEFHIGLSSGLSWLSWALNNKTVVISGFSEPYTEMSDCIRIYTEEESTCKGCFNSHKLDPSDWRWCPMHKGTDREFECTKKISVEQVINRIKELI